MGKSEIIVKLKNKSLIVVVRGDTFEQGYQISKACIAGGIKNIEVAYTNSNASKIIQQLNQEYENQDIIVGAGTVLDDITARMAIMAGAKFIVAPTFSKETAILCNRYQIPYLPGCMSVQEIQNAFEFGCEIIKLFPGSVFNYNYINAIKAPLPQANIMVTGGVNLDNVDKWFESGVCSIGIGGEFNKLGLSGDYNKISELANLYVKKVQGI